MKRQCKTCIYFKEHPIAPSLEGTCWRYPPTFAGNVASLCPDADGRLLNWTRRFAA